MNVSVKVTTNTSQIHSKLSQGLPVVNAQMVIAFREMVKPLVPYQKGALRQSAETSSLPERGKLIYSEVYSAYQYYAGPNKRTPGTVNRWGDVGKSRYMPNVMRIAEIEVRRLFGN